jgi:peroxiredoxin
VLGEGTEAPTFELPGVVEGRPVRVRLDSLLGESVVVLVFYPADFNPSCTDETTDLDEFDVFGMQSDATVLGVSGDSVYSHRAFADAYDLKLPLLADVDGEVARSYGVTAEDGRYPTRRAVVVIDHERQVTYTWVGADIERPDVEAVQTAFAGIDDINLAETQYREGCDRYDEATEMFVEGGVQATASGCSLAVCSTSHGRCSRPRPSSSSAPSGSVRSTGWLPPSTRAGP